METGENKPKHKWKNVHVDTNLTTGKRYFEKKKVEIIDPAEPPEEPPKPVVPAQSGLGGDNRNPDTDTSVSDWTDH